MSVEICACIGLTAVALIAIVGWVERDLKTMDRGER